MCGVWFQIVLWKFEKLETRRSGRMHGFVSTWGNKFLPHCVDDRLAALDLLKFKNV